MTGLVVGLDLSGVMIKSAARTAEAGSSISGDCSIAIVPAIATWYENYSWQRLLNLLTNEGAIDNNNIELCMPADQPDDGCISDVMWIIARMNARRNFDLVDLLSGVKQSLCFLFFRTVQN